MVPHSMPAVIAFFEWDHDFPTGQKGKRNAPGSPPLPGPACLPSMDVNAITGEMLPFGAGLRGMRALRRLPGLPAFPPVREPDPAQDKHNQEQFRSQC